MTLPEGFASSLSSLLGSGRASTVMDALTTGEPTVSLRVNRFKSSATPAVGASPVPWCPGGWYLDGHPNFTFDPLFHAGHYYVQEASSMFIAEVLRQTVAGPVRMLDLCAAPGGKSTCAMASLPQGSVLMANEPVRPRAQVLAENMVKFGHPDTWTTSHYAADIARERLTFDVILTDVPCSGEGMMRKEPVAVSQWSPQLTEQCATLQRSIVEDIWPCLRPGGLLIYSTCTFNRLEDEDNAQWIARSLGADFVGIDLDSSWGIASGLVDGVPTLRFLPGFVRGEGLFMAVLRKHGESDPWNGDRRKLKTGRLHVLAHGIAPDYKKGRKTLPDISRALSILPCDYPTVSVDYPTAIAYLRHEALVLPPDAPRGIVAVAYAGARLGFANNLGSRANNLYPPEWRIRSSHVPEQHAILKE